MKKLLCALLFTLTCLMTYQANAGPTKKDERPKFIVMNVPLQADVAIVQEVKLNATENMVLPESPALSWRQGSVSFMCHPKSTNSATIKDGYHQNRLHIDPGLN